MTKTTASDGGMAAVLLAAFFLGCGNDADPSGETHFPCKTTADCVEHATDLVCVERVCQRAPDGSAGQSGGGGGGFGGTTAPVGGAGGRATTSGGAGGRITVSGGGDDAGSGPADASMSAGGTSDDASDGATDGEAGPSRTNRDAGPPAQGAMTVRVSPNQGSTCPASGFYLSSPSNDSTGVFDHLQCDLSIGCHPDQYVSIDGDPFTKVSCAVVPSDGGYSLSVSLNVDDTTHTPIPSSVSFQASGTVSPTGGPISITETNSAYGGGGTDTSCTFTITPNQGFIAPGKVWGAFSCANFRDPKGPANTRCTADGFFLFENCSTH